MFLALYVKKYLVIEKADTKGGNRYLYPIFIIVSNLPVIPASQTLPCLGENRTLSKNALGFYAKMHKKLVNYS